MDAIRAMGRAAGARGAIWRERLEGSVKLSSIHPRYDAASYAQVRGELLDRLKQIAGRAAAAGIGVTVDAEESERLSLQLDLFEARAADPALDRWGGLGLAVQAYQLRALETVDALLEIAGRRRKRGGMPVAVRLVKGAYWDAEVKRAQELGLERYPVFTDKRLTDLSYLACARRLSSGLDSVYPQFATHNPGTLACVLVLTEQPAAPSPAAPRFQCQRLHGMDMALSRTLAAWAESVNEARRRWTAGSLVSGRRGPGPARPAVSPARPDVTIGEVSDATPDTARSAIDAAQAARIAWSAVSVPERAAALERLADLLEADMAGPVGPWGWGGGGNLAPAQGGGGPGGGLFPLL